MRLEKLLLRGAVLGFLLPAFSFMAYAYIRSDGDFLALYYQLEVLGVHTQVMSLCVLVNIVPFLIFIRAKREKPAQGILLTTILFALLIALDKMI